MENDIIIINAINDHLVNNSKELVIIILILILLINFQFIIIKSL